MWRIVLIFFQIAICMVHENAADPSTNINPTDNNGPNRPLIRIPLALTSPFGKGDNAAHSRVRRSSDTDQNLHVEGSVDNTKIYKTILESDGYVSANISVGTPPQNILFNLDTGSTDILVPIVDCKDGTVKCDNIGTYNYSLSDSYVRVGGIIVLSYGSAIDSVLRTQDRITIGNLVIEGHTIGETNQMNDLKSNNLSRGLFGLGLGESILSSDNKTAIDRLKDQGDITARIFCFHISATTDFQYPILSGELIIGGCDVQAQHTEKLVDTTKWVIKMPSITINGSNISYRRDDYKASMDTGTATIVGPRAEIEQINQLLGAIWDEKIFYYTKVVCKRNELPDVKFKFGTFEVVLSPDDYFQFIKEGEEIACISRFRVSGANNNLDDDTDLFVIGHPLLRKIVTIFNKETNEIGLAHPNRID